MKHNLIEYFKSFYSMGLQHSFDTESQCLFWALLYKFNSLLYRDSIRISNNELIHLAGIPLRSFYRHRELLIKYLHDDGDPDSWIVKYTAGSTREYGTYQINFPYLQTFVKIELVPNIQQNGIIDNTANELVPNMQQNCRLDELASSLKGTSLQNDDKNGTPSYTILDKDKDKTSSSAKTVLVQSTDNQPKNVPNVSSSQISASSRDASGRYRTAWDNNFGDNGNGKKPIKPPDAESNFEFINSRPRNEQPTLLKQLSEQKQVEFYEWVKAQDKEGE